jgi:hypothetical protein
MLALRVFGPTAFVLVLGTTPLAAQAVIQEPGYCAFFYPNANCQNKGPGNPYTDPNYQPPGAGPYARAGSNDGPVAATPRHIRRHRSQ